MTEVLTTSAAIEALRIVLRVGQMKKILFILLITFSPACADDQTNVYDVFRQTEQNSDSAIVDEQLTARIKRHMANLLYPVDMASFVRPEKDVKFREQIITLQRQMGVPATGALTFDQFVRLADAARDIDDRAVGTYPGKFVFRSDDGEWVTAVGTGTNDNRDDPLAHPINISRISCRRAVGICELSTAEFSPEDSQLYFPTPFEYSITTWEPTRVTATSEHPCGTALMSIDIKAESVTISRVPHSDLSFCPKGLKPTTWRLADDGFPLIWKFHQDKVNKARALVYEQQRRLVPPAAAAIPIRR
jgi:hypothetical protein